VVAAEEQQAEGAQGRAVTADPMPNVALAGGSASIQPQPAGAVTSSHDEVSTGATGWRGRAATQATTLVSPLALARAAVEAHVTVWSYLRKEGEAALAHMRALSTVTSPSEVVDRQASEMTRALRAALSLGQDLAERAGRVAEEQASAPKDKR